MLQYSIQPLKNENYVETKALPHEVNINFLLIIVRYTLNVYK